MSVGKVTDMTNIPQHQPPTKATDRLPDSRVSGWACAGVGIGNSAALACTRAACPSRTASWTRSFRVRPPVTGAWARWPTAKTPVTSSGCRGSPTSWGDDTVRRFVSERDGTRLDTHQPVSPTLKLLRPTRRERRSGLNLGDPNLGDPAPAQPTSRAIARSGIDNQVGRCRASYAAS